MNTYLPQSLVWEHIRESRQQAAAVRQVITARGAHRRTATRTRRPGHRLARGA
jgi:hypothetical protein